MAVIRVRLLPACVVALGIALGLSAILAGQTGGNASKTGGNTSNGDTEWRFFGSDAGATRYSPANQIDASNVQSLGVAWRFSTRNLGPRPATGMQVSPLIVDGVM
jgi:glucose dehydrogenase